MWCMSGIPPLYNQARYRRATARCVSTATITLSTQYHSTVRTAGAFIVGMRIVCVDRVEVGGRG